MTRGFATALACFALSTGFANDIAGTRDDEIKAVRLLNFLKFVEWPASVPRDVLIVCFVQSDAVQQAFAANAQTKRVGERRLDARALTDADPREACNVLYLGSAAGFLARGAARSKTLTVGEAKDFSEHGGMIEMLVGEDKRLRFVVNIDNVRRGGLRISSKLLAIATVRN